MFAGNDRSARTSSDEIHPPLTLTLPALYVAGFAVYALYVLVRESAHMRSSFSDAWFPLLACASAAAVPLLLAIGLWLMDSAARIAVLVLLGLHAISLVVWVQHTGNSTAPMPEIKLLLDAATAALLLSRSARRSCRWEPAGLFADRG